MSNALFRWPFIVHPDVDMFEVLAEFADIVEFSHSELAEALSCMNTSYDGSSLLLAGCGG